MNWERIRSCLLHCRGGVFLRGGGAGVVVRLGGIGSKAPGVWNAEGGVRVAASTSMQGVD